MLAYQKNELIPLHKNWTQTIYAASKQIHAATSLKCKHNQEKLHVINCESSKGDNMAVQCTTMNCEISQHANSTEWLDSAHCSDTDLLLRMPYHELSEQQRQSCLLLSLQLVFLQEQLQAQQQVCIQQTNQQHCVVSSTDQLLGEFRTQREQISLCKWLISCSNISNIYVYSRSEGLPGRRCLHLERFAGGCDFRSITASVHTCLLYTSPSPRD